MPQWVIVGELENGAPAVLCEWVMDQQWMPIADVKVRNQPVLTFRDRWRAKRQARRLPRELAPRCVRLDRL